MDAYKRREFHKNCANESPPSGKFIGRIPKIDSFGAIEYSHISDLINVKFGTRDRPPLAKFHIYRGGAMCRPCRDTNPIVDH